MPTAPHSPKFVLAHSTRHSDPRQRLRLKPKLQPATPHRIRQDFPIPSDLLARLREAGRERRLGNRVNPTVFHGPRLLDSEGMRTLTYPPTRLPQTRRRSAPSPQQRGNDDLNRRFLEGPNTALPTDWNTEERTAPGAPQPRQRSSTRGVAAPRSRHGTSSSQSARPRNLPPTVPVWC